MSDEWRTYFDGLVEGTSENADIAHSEVVSRMREMATAPGAGPVRTRGNDIDAQKQVAVLQRSTPIASAAIARPTSIR